MQSPSVRPSAEDYLDRQPQQDSPWFIPKADASFESAGLSPRQKTVAWFALNGRCGQGILKRHRRQGLDTPKVLLPSRKTVEEYQSIFRLLDRWLLQNA